VAYHQELQELNAEIADACLLLKDAESDPMCGIDTELGWLADNRADMWRNELTSLKNKKRELLSKGKLRASLTQKQYLTSPSFFSYWKGYEDAMSARGKFQPETLPLTWEEFSRPIPMMIQLGIVEEDENLEEMYAMMNSVLIATARHLLELSDDDVFEQRHQLVDTLIKKLSGADLTETLSTIMLHGSDAPGDHDFVRATNTVIGLWNKKLLAGELA
jgi:hypothetical protein